MTRMPPNLSDKLDTLLRQVRARRIARGVGIVLALLALLALAAVAADRWLALSAGVRWLMLGTWLSAGAVTAWLTLARPLRRSLSSADVAAAVEREHPALAERISSTVELTEADAHGSPALINLLAAETEIRTRRLDLGSHMPSRPAGWPVIAAMIAGGGLVIALAVAPGFKDSARRFFAPWYTPAKEATYRLVVTSGEPAIQRGTHVTLSGYVEALIEGAELPTTATLLIAEGDEPPEELAMDSERPHVFFHRREGVRDDFRYAIRAGDVQSDWLRIRAVDPVTITDDTEMTLTPPEYAASALGGDEPVPGLQSVSLLQFGTIQFDIGFTAPPESAHFEWRERPAPSSPPGEAKRLPIILDGDRGRLTHEAAADGTLTLIIESAEGLRTELPPLSVEAKADVPPKFGTVSGVPSEGRIPPGESVPIDFAATDDVAVASAALEYRVDDGDVTELPLEPAGLGTGEIHHKYALDLTDKVRENQRFRFRVRVTDGRDFPERNLSPQSAYYPAGDKWAELRIDPRSVPLREQEIADKQKDIDSKLDELIRELKADARSIDRLKAETRAKSRLNLQEEVRLRNIRDRIGENADALEQLARDAALSPELAALAGRMGDVADRQLRDAEKALAEAQRAAKGGEREQKLGDAFEQTDEAVRRLEQLREENDRLAKQRLTREKLQQLADAEERLADEADETDREELRKRQQELKDELERLAKENPELREAMDASKSAEAQRLAEKARDLADRQRELRQAMQETEAKERGEQFADLLKRQEELTERLRQFARDNEDAARAAPAAKLDTEPAEQALESLRQGKMTPALTEAARAAINLDRMAKEFDQAAGKADDPREAARQLARLQDALRRRFAEESQNPPVGEQLEELTRRQKAIAEEIDKLSVPPEDRAAGPEQRNARSQAEQAAEAMAEGDPLTAERRMAEARDSLNRLAENMKPGDERRAEAQEAVRRMRREQDKLTQQPNEADQKNLADRLAKTDTPNQEGRRDQAAEAMRRAAEAMADGQTEDAGAAQREAARELQRLEDALSGKEPADEKADRLAKKQQEIAEQADRLAKKPEGEDAKAEMQRLRGEQDRLAKELESTPAPEAPLQREEAGDAVERAQQAAGEQDPERLAREGQDAADKLQQLADRMNGRQSPAEQADRLARRQQEAANRAEQRGDQPAEPQENRDAEQLARQMAEELKRMPAGDAQQQKQEAMDALERVQREKPAENAEGQRDAAEKLQELAKKLGEQQPQPGGEQGEGQKQGSTLPSRETAEQARELAREMRELREQMHQSDSELRNQGRPQPESAEGNPVGELAREQEDLAQQAEELARSIQERNGGSSRQGDQAQRGAEAAREAARRMQAGAMEAAKQAGQRAAQQMEQLAQSAEGDTRQQAGELARRQEELNRRANPLADDPGAARAQQQDRQRDLAREADQLARQMRDAAREMRNQPGMDAGEGESAAEAAREAQVEMSRAANRDREGRPSAGDEARGKAAEQLDRAARQAMQAAGRNPDADPSQQRQLGETLREAMDRMAQAEGQLGADQPGSAGQSMREASEQLSKASQQFGPGEPTPGEPQGEPQGGDMGSGREAEIAELPLAEMIGPEAAEKYSGKSWGELPGDVRSRIIEGMRERYGIDDARVIKYYFEQIAGKP